MRVWIESGHELTSAFTGRGGLRSAILCARRSGSRPRARWCTSRRPGPPTRRPSACALPLRFCPRNSKSRHCFCARLCARRAAADRNRPASHRRWSSSSRPHQRARSGAPRDSRGHARRSASRPCPPRTASSAIACSDNPGPGSRRLRAFHMSRRGPRPKRPSRSRSPSARFRPRTSKSRT